MARIGSFLGPTAVYGAPLSVVHPSDNNVASSRFHPLLMNPALHLDDARRQELQDEVMGLFAVLKTAANLPPSQ